MNGIVYRLGMKTGLGVHSSPVHTFAPRSYQCELKLRHGVSDIDDLR